jgi:hypothetical protein
LLHGPGTGVSGAADEIAESMKVLAPHAAFFTLDLRVALDERWDTADIERVIRATCSAAAPHAATIARVGPRATRSRRAGRRHHRFRRHRLAAFWATSLSAIVGFASYWLWLRFGFWHRVYLAVVLYVAGLVLAHDYLCCRS